MFDGPSDDRLAIRERIDAYGDAVFRHDADAWIANWTPDCVWKLPSLGIDLTGHAAVRAAWEQAMSAFAQAAFFAVPGMIKVTGDRAAARVYTQEVLIDHAGTVRRIVGAYHDELIKADGVWLFASRAYTVLHDDAKEV